MSWTDVFASVGTGAYSDRDERCFLAGSSQSQGKAKGRFCPKPRDRKPLAGKDGVFPVVAQGFAVYSISLGQCPSESKDR